MCIRDRNACDRRLHLAFELVELGEIGRGIGLVARLARRIGRAQRIPDIRDIELRIGDALPGMRIVMAMGMRVAALALLVMVVIGFERGDACLLYTSRCV